jgi:hypothetical protein
MIPARAVLLSESASETLDSLDTDSFPRARVIARRARALRPILLVDCLHGEVVRKDAIPKRLREKHGLTNLYVEDLPDFWRMLYTVVKQNGTRTIVVVEIVNHKTYSRWFPGRRN